MELTTKQKAAFGIGAVGKDMVYALSRLLCHVLVSGWTGPAGHLWRPEGDDRACVGRLQRSVYGGAGGQDPHPLGTVPSVDLQRHRPECGGSLRAVRRAGAGRRRMMVYFSVIYILWGVTYTMMDIPYWSMIPAVTAPRPTAKTCRS